jgi:hypothetical protein
MFKVLGLFSILLITQVAFANDFLRSGKQLLVCVENHSFFRINWEDFEIEKRSLSSRSRNVLFKLSPQIERGEVEDMYRVDVSFQIYKDGRPDGGGGGGFKVGPDIGSDSLKFAYPMKLRYIDKELADSGIAKICAK